MKSIITPYQQKALNYKKHISLTANAGSGKTFVLSHRFVEIAINENVNIDNIVAITFTEKAASELYKKISEEINNRLKDEIDIKIKSKLINLRQQLVSANISTIHSFCINILKEFAPEADIDANFTPLNETDSDEILNIIIDSEINKELSDNTNSENVKYLIRTLGSKDSLLRQTKEMIKKRKNIEIIEKKFFSVPIEQTSNKYRQTFDEYFKKLFEYRINDVIQSIKKINEQVLDNSAENEKALLLEKAIKEIKEKDNPFTKIAKLRQIEKVMLTKQGEILKSNYLPTKLRDSLHEEIKIVEEFFDDISKINISENSNLIENELAKFGSKILIFYHRILELYTLKKKQRGYLDFEDILILTKNLLIRDEVKTYLSKKYKYIMVDEYQDTNEIQYEIIMPILDYLKINNLFVVGDEKQSIYMFRDAELEVFYKTKKEIESVESSESILTLPHSFRMSPEIAAFINLLFREIFKNPNQPFNEVKYDELICAKNQTGNSGIELLISDEETSDPENILVAQKILQLVNPSQNYKLNFGDIALLCRKRDQFNELEKALIKFKIPYLIIGGKGFFQRQLVYDIYNFISFLLDENNDPALIGILRSPFYSLPDTKIFLISLEEGKNYYNKLINYSKPQGDLKDIILSLQKYKELIGKINLASLLRLIIKETPYLTVIASKHNAAQEIANLEKLLSIAYNFSRQDFKTPYDFVDYLKSSIEAYEEEGQAQLIKNDNSVKLMTIHQSKGLEFKAVFIYGANLLVRNSNIKSNEIVIDKNFGLLTKVPIENNYFSNFELAPIGGIYNLVYAKKNLAEMKRLLYVAATRASNYLFISATLKNGKTKKNSFIDLICSALNIDFSKNSFTVKSLLKFMILSENKFISDEKEIKFEIPIIKQIELPIKREEKIQSPSKKNLLINDIVDHPKGEIISATKISIFSQCPTKYLLTYELGYVPILKKVKEYIDNFDFNYSEDEETTNFADLKGRIIHKLLEKEIPQDKIQDETKMLLSNEQELKTRLDLLETVSEEITNELQKYFNSSAYKALKKYNNHQNEFEIYAQEGGNYLYGIVDKLIVENESLIIIDYKTDRIDKTSIHEKAQAYFVQLTFYAYVLSKFYSNINNFELRLLFIREPEEYIIKKITRAELSNFGNELKSIINKIKLGQFQPERSHCPKCHFALKENTCIKDFLPNKAV